MSKQKPKRTRNNLNMSMRSAKKADKKYLKLMQINVPKFKIAARKSGNKKRANYL